MTGKSSIAFTDAKADTSRNLHTPRERLPEETHELYKERRRIFNRKRKEHLRGTMVRPGSSMVPMKNPETGKVIKDAKGETRKMRVNHKPFVGSIKSLIKGQA